MPSSAVDLEVAERLRLRYPKSRVPRAALVTVVAVIAALALTWLLWAASVRSNPPVTGRIASYTVLSDTEVAFTLTVERPDPSRAAVCRVQAQSEDVQVVGAVDVAIPPRSERLVDVALTVKTLRRATNASYQGCSLR